MEYRDQMFQATLANYPIKLIREGFVKHVSRKPTLPTPSDIINIIDPPEPEPSASVYIGLQNKIKGGRYTTKKERDYLTWCEEKAIAKPLEWRETINELEKRMTYENQN